MQTTTQELRARSGSPHIGKPRDELPKWRQKLLGREPLEIQESFDALTDGFHRFEQRTKPACCSGVALRRVAGNIFEQNDQVARKEVRRLLENIKEGGVFLFLGHGGHFPCGAVAAKKSHLDNKLNEPETVAHILEHIPDDVKELCSPNAEFVNTVYQARDFLDDHEFAETIKRKNITVVAGLCNGPDIEFLALNKQITPTELLIAHPKLEALKTQMNRAFNAATNSEGKDLTTHFAHLMFVFDPIEFSPVLSSSGSELDVGGFCCIDARLPPRTPGPRYLFRMKPGEAVCVSGSFNGEIQFTMGELESVGYGLRRVDGLNVHKNGNGHMVIISTDLGKSLMAKSALLARVEFLGLSGLGDTISVASFDRQRLMIQNPYFGLEINLPYNPVVQII
ncbi:MAG: hypothetical protein HZA83_02740 [Thaumarchaeota archaeon]|nr:hypothetical protein [Nitrososphaerota archaeon]